MNAASGVDETLVKRVQADVTDAVSYVHVVWDGPWSDVVAVHVAPDGAAVAAEAAGLAVGAGQVDQVAAVAVVPTGMAGDAAARAGTDSAAGQSRLIVNAEVYGRLSDVGGQVVARHEVTHLASASATPPDLPVWLVEGFADAVARTSLADDPATAAVELAAEVKAGRVPAAPPEDDAFAGADGRLAQTYQQAWLACRLVAERAGLAGLVRLYREAGAGTAAAPAPASARTVTGSGESADPTDRLDAALVDVTGLGLAAFTAAWHDYLVDTLA